MPFSGRPGLAGSVRERGQISEIRERGLVRRREDSLLLAVKSDPVQGNPVLAAGSWEGLRGEIDNA